VTGVYRSPLTGAVLAPEGDTLLRDDDGRLWPIIDGIPYLRTGRDELVAEAAAYLRADDREAALVLLLADQDDWWTGPKPDPADLGHLVRNCDRLTLRDAMACLAFGRVGDYFAHRWTDPTFLAGLALIGSHWREPTGGAFELACGIGHYGRALAHRGVAYTGADVVFAKLWLARHWVLPPAAELVCFDAAAPWPFADRRFDLVFCHDAFYFLEPKRLIRDRLGGLVQPAGRLAVSHIHNRHAANLSSGHAVSADEVDALFPGAAVYDDAELTAAFVDDREPQPRPLAELGGVEAFSVEAHPGGIDADVHRGETLVPPGDRGGSGPASFGTPPVVAAQDEGGGGRAVCASRSGVAAGALRLNPLYADTEAGWRIDWPSPRYAQEYGPRATFPMTLDRDAVESLIAAQRTGRDEPALAEAIRRRILVDLPERW
jgi:hypothetical protein